MIKNFILIFLVLTAQRGAAQYFQFSQYNYTSQRISPAAPAATDYAQMSFIYRNQSTGGDQKLSSNMISANYPLVHKKNGRRWSGIGMTLLDDRSGGMYSVTEGTLSYAVNIFLSEFQSLSFGMKGMYQQRKIDINSLTTGLQFVPDRGFDQYASSGEDIGAARMAYATVSSGLSWQRVNEDGIQLSYMSCSLFDFNKPKDSFTGDHKLNSTLVMAGGFRMLKKNNLSLFPEMLYTTGARNNVFNVGLITRCDVKATGKEKAFYVDLITKYVAHRSAILGLQFHNEKFSFGVSYDFPSHRNPGNLSAFEIAIELKKLMAPTYKSRLAKKKANQKKQVAAKKIPEKKPVLAKMNADSLKQKEPIIKDLAGKLQTKRDSVIANAKAGQISHDPFVLDKVILHFNFKFNSSELDETSTAYLDDLIIALEQDEHLRIKLTGHTDNIGSAKFNDRLSFHRANAIKKYMLSRGVDPGRVTARGKGMSEPLNDNKTDEDRAKNRRVELTILYQE
jgi:type IX secretion system PorP/SprF family membrane protein